MAERPNVTRFLYALGSVSPLLRLSTDTLVIALVTDESTSPRGNKQGGDQLVAAILFVQPYRPIDHQFKVLRLRTSRGRIYEKAPIRRDIVPAARETAHPHFKKRLRFAALDSAALFVHFDCHHSQG